MILLYWIESLRIVLSLRDVLVWKQKNFLHWTRSLTGRKIALTIRGVAIFQHEWNAFNINIKSNVFFLLFRLETSREALTAAQKEHESLSELNEMLRRHNDNLKNQHDWWVHGRSIQFDLHIQSALFRLSNCVMFWLLYYAATV